MDGRACAVGAARRHGPVHRGGGGPPPPRAGRPARDRRRPRRPDRAGGGLDGVLRGARVRGALRDAAAGRRTQVPRRGVAAGRRPGVRRGVGRGDGHAARGPRRRGRGARLGRGVRRDRDRRPGGGGPRRIQADVLAATGLHCSVGIGDTKVRAKIATEFGKPRGHLPADPRQLVRGDGRPAHRDAVGHRQPHLRSGSPALGIDDRARAGRDARRAAGRRVRAQHRPAHRPARPRREQQRRRRHPLGGPGPRPRDDLPAGPRPPRRGRRRRSGRWPRRWSRTSAAEGRACARVHLKVRFAPFFTVNRSRKLAEPDVRRRA